MCTWRASVASASCTPHSRIRVPYHQPPIRQMRSPITAPSAARVVRLSRLSVVRLPLRRRRRLYCNPHLPLVLVRRHQRVRVGRLVEGEDLVQDGANLPLVHQLVRALRLVRIGEVRAEDLLLPHPQVPYVELEVEAGGGAADDDLPEALGEEDAGGEGLLADV